MLFGWTAPALLAGMKSCSRQTWAPRLARQFRDQLLVDAFDRDPQRRGRQLAIIRLRGDPEFQPLSAMPDSDYEAEGWRWLYQHPEAFTSTTVRREDFSWEAFDQWRRRPYSVWVVRFEVVALQRQVDRLAMDAGRLQRELDRALLFGADRPLD